MAPQPDFDSARETLAEPVFTIAEKDEEMVNTDPRADGDIRFRLFDGSSSLCSAKR